ncbi:MAG: hypothetical protein Q8P20_03690 [bacterium]|nr:hypothetical protein [bacterium]
MYEVKKINVLSAAKICTFIIGGSYIIWGVIFGGAMFLFSGFYSNDLFSYGGFPIIAILIGIVASAAIGFGLGALVAFIYNIVAGWLGGIKIDIQLVHEEDHKEN